MARNTNAPVDDVTKQRLLTKRYEKEKMLRLQQWYQQTKNRKLDQEEPIVALPPSFSRQYEVSRRKLQLTSLKVPEALLSLRNVRHSADYRRRRHLPSDSELNLPPVKGDDINPVNSWTNGGENPLQAMIQSDEVVKKKLYEGTTKEGRGRAEYLACRSQRRPESRYRFPVLSSWTYGWNVRDVVSGDEPSRNAQNKRRNLVQDTFYTRNGISLLPV